MYLRALFRVLLYISAQAELSFLLCGFTRTLTKRMIIRVCVFFVCIGEKWIFRVYFLQTNDKEIIRNIYFI